MKLDKMEMGSPDVPFNTNNFDFIFSPSFHSRVCIISLKKQHGTDTHELSLSMQIMIWFVSLNTIQLEFYVYIP